MTTIRDDVRFELAGGVGVITLNRPDALNAINMSVAAGLRERLAQCAAEGARAVVLRGTGRSFCGGGDIGEMLAHRETITDYIAGIIDTVHAFILALAAHPVPVIASAHGPVAGGGFSIAMACDMVVAARNARFIVAYPKLSSSTDAGLSFHLARVLGAKRGMEALALNGAFDADEALRLGLVNQVVDADTADDGALALARRIAEASPESVKEMKGLVHAAAGQDLAAHLDREKAAFLRCAAHPDFLLRLQEFLAKSRK